MKWALQTLLSLSSGSALIAQAPSTGEFVAVIGVLLILATAVSTYYTIMVNRKKLTEPDHALQEVKDDIRQIYSRLSKIETIAAELRGEFNQSQRIRRD